MDFRVGMAGSYFAPGQSGSCADATETPQAGPRGDAPTRDRVWSPSAYRMLVALESPVLNAGGRSYPLAPGMQVSAEFNLGTRSVLEYLLSPVRPEQSDLPSVWRPLHGVDVVPHHIVREGPAIAHVQPHDLTR